MEYYSTKQPENYSLIKGIFYLILGTTILGLVLLFTLSIDKKASVTEGEIISQNAPIKYLAPESGALSQILVKEGDQVMAGDKLIVIKSNKLEDDLEKARRELRAAKENILFHKKQLVNIKLKMNKSKEDISIQERKYRSEKIGSQQDLQKIDMQFRNYEEKIGLSKKRIDKLEKLYKSGGISGNDFDKTYKSYLDELNRIIGYKNQLLQENNKSTGLDLDFENEKNKNNISILKSQGDLLKKEQDIIDEERKIKTLESEIEFINKGLESLVLKATIDGYITDLFTTKLKTIFIAKDQQLLILHPLSEQEFFAKVSLKEEELKDVRSGQEVNLRLSAFNHYQYGVLQGQVMHVNKEIIEKETTITNEQHAASKFYAFVSISETEALKFNIKSGFKVTGDVILGRVKLYRYIIESILKK